MIKFYDFLHRFASRLFIWKRRPEKWAINAYSEKDIDELVNGLKKKGNSFLKRLYALNYLRKIEPIDDKNAIKVIENALSKKTFFPLRRLAAITLGEIGSKISYEMFLCDNEKKVKQYEEQLNTLLKKLKDKIKTEKSVVVLERLVESIGKIGPIVNRLDNEELFTELKSLLEKKTKVLIKQRIAQSLGKIRTNNEDLIIKLFSICLSKDNKLLRINAIWALGEIGDKELEKYSDEILKLITLMKNTRSIYFKNTIAFVLSKIVNSKHNNYESVINTLKSEIEKNDDTFYFAIALAKFEGRDSIGHKEIMKLLRKRSIDYGKQILYNDLLYSWQLEKLNQTEYAITHKLDSSEAVININYQKNIISESKENRIRHIFDNVIARVIAHIISFIIGALIAYWVFSRWGFII